MTDQLARTEGGDTARRALALLEVVCASRTPVTLDHLAAATGLSKSMTYRLVRVLSEELMIERSKGGSYRVGSRFVALAAAAMPQFNAASLAQPLLQQLADEAGETATLHRRVGLSTVLILGVETSQTLRRVAQPGDTTPIARGCAGIAIVSALTEEEKKDIYRAVEANGGDAVGVQAAAEAAHADGFALSFGANHPGLNGIAAPVRTGRPVELSVVVAGPEARWTEETMRAFAPRLREVADSLGDLLA